MKKISALLLIFLTLTLSFSQTFLKESYIKSQMIINGYNLTPTIPQLGLVAYWPFNGNANDQSGSGYTGTVNGATPTTGINGDANSALDFDGLNDYVDFGDILDMGTSDYSFSFWIQAATIQNALTGIINKTKLAPGVGRYFMIFSTDIIASLETTSGVIQATALTDVKDDTWHHIVVVYDRSASMTIYIDKVSEDSKSIAGDVAEDYQNAFSFFIGAYTDATGTAPAASTYYDGKIDEVAVYNRTLTTEDIDILFNVKK